MRWPGARDAGHLPFGRHERHENAPGFGYGLPDLQAENVEISQGIQSETWDDTSGAYTGVPLVRDVPTVVRVYASVVADRTTRTTRRHRGAGTAARVHRRRHRAGGESRQRYGENVA